MKKNILQLIKISLVFLLILTINNPVSAVKGTEVWSEDGYIIFDSDVNFIFNRAYYPVEGFPNVDVSDGEITIKHTGLNNVGNMLFTSASSNTILSAIFFNGEVVTSVIDPETGLNEENEPTFRFGTTENWEDGFETDFKEIFDYTDDLGIHSDTIKYVVDGDSFDYSMKVDNVDKTVTSWNLEIDLELNYNDEGFTIQEKNLLRFVITDGNGVLLKSLVRQEVNIKAIEDTTFETLFFFEFSMEAIKSDGVKLNPSSSGSDSGFVSSLYPWTVLFSLAILVSFYRKRKS